MAIKLSPEQLAYEALCKIAALPFAKTPDETPAAIIAAAIRVAIEKSELDAARYRWLREENAYRPEEMGVTGEDRLEAMCDDGLAGGIGDPDARRVTPSLDEIAADLSDRRTFSQGFDSDDRYRERIQESIRKGARTAPKKFGCHERRGCQPG